MFFSITTCLYLLTIPVIYSNIYRSHSTNFINFIFIMNISLNYKPCIFKKVTDIEHQRSDTANCGSYSLYYIWKRLNGTSSEYFANNQIIDEDMESFRKFLWRTHK